MTEEERDERYANRPVLGHLCDGLRRIQRDGRGCVPCIDDDGLIQGCDDGQRIPITHCPMCGEKLVKEQQ